MLVFFTAVLTLTDDFKPVASSFKKSKVVWMTLKARTNGFTVGAQYNAIDGFRIPETASLDLPVTGLVNIEEPINLAELYWKNTTAASNAIVEIIGMRVV